MTDQRQSIVPAARVAGWVAFSAVMLLLAGAVNLVNGFTALHDPGSFTNRLAISNLTVWGWVFLIWGGLQVVASGLVLRRNLSGYRIGAFLAATAALLWFVMIFAAPWAALAGITVNTLVLHGLTVGCGDAGRAT